MPKKAKELRALEVGRLTDPGFHAVGGVAGLALTVSKTGARSWILRVTVGPRRRDIGLGGFPDVPLADARVKAREYRARIEEGIDPAEQRRALKAAVAAVVTFDEAARRFIAAKRSGWKNAKHADQWANTLKAYASPMIGRMNVDQIELCHVVDTLTPIWESKTETATRVRSRIEAILGWATVRGYRKGDNPARWAGNLEHAMPEPKKDVEHFAALPWEEVPAFLKALAKQPGMAARAVEFAVLTAARSGEIRGARWDEIDLAKKVWTVPASRMKSGVAHEVPLAARAMALLRALPRIKDNELVFPAPRGGVYSDMAMLQVMRRLEVAATVHGFRSSFRNFAGDATDVARDVAEAALAHTVRDKTEAAYLRSTFMVKRRTLMTQWGVFCATGKKPKKPKRK